ncbi:Fibronectin type III domain-containing protein [Spirosomataceae bacterium TFI 002]|nr:Fibronectin type III domain-containing protein [Spirosomataceae bacterium TFI 002]
MKSKLLITSFSNPSASLKCFIAFLISLTSFGSIAQVTISNPINRAVYQRTGAGNGTANLIVSGSHSTTMATSAQARLVSPGTNNAISGFDWKVIDKGPTRGVFYGSLNNVPPGWYTLQVRIMKEGVLQQSAQVDRVGVGDVFLIAGQSNATGWDESYGYLGSNNEKVVSHNFSLPCPTTFPDYPTMGQIAASDKLGITGENAWAYGKLGEDLVNQTGFPVAFFNGGAIGSSVLNYTQSMNGQSTIHPFTNNQFCSDFSNPIGQPYRTLQTAMSYYNSLFGMKAVLWHQGESDTHQSTSTGDYQSRLNSLISFVRNDFDPNYTMPWVVSRASHVFGAASSAVIAGQTNVISGDSQVFAGPSTDGILGIGKRDDGTHFTGSGIFDLAVDWKNSLNPSFFSSANSKAANTQPALSYAISGNNVTLTAPSASSYRWVSGNNYNGTSLGTNASYTASSGTYRCYLTDVNGNITISQAVDVTKVKTQSDNNINCTTFAYLSDLKPFSIANGYGPIGLDKSNGEELDGDGTTLTLNGVTYAKGVGVHANSELVYLLPSNKFFNFIADIGIDDEVGSLGKVKFQIFNDNTMIYESPEMTGSSSTITVNQSIIGVTKLRLKVVDINGFGYDHGDWANARLTCTPPDLVPPSNPSNLTVVNQLTKCFGLTWTASTDNIGVGGYYVFLNGNNVATLAANQLSYSFTNLTKNTAYTVAVQAFDVYGNLSSIISLPTTTLDLIADYPGSSNPLFGDICVNTVEIPDKIPNGGLFEFVSGPSPYTLNASTGGFSSSVLGFFGIKYTIDKGGVCEDVLNVNVRTNTKPSPTSITGGPTLINIGTSADFTSAGCVGGHTWQDNSNQSTLSFSPSDTTKVFVFCRNNGCLSDTSNQILVKVIPDCPNAFNLVSTKDDLNGTPPSLYFKASTKIDAENKLSGSSTTYYKAGKSIFLKPGFNADSGTVFSATIEGCP